MPDNQIQNNNQVDYHQNQMGMGKGGIVGSNGDVNVSLMCENIDALPQQSISEEEKEGLLEMREDWISKTDNEDIKLVYENLMKGSRNHMRAFVRMLDSYGANYTPQYISSEEYEQILSSSMERGGGPNR